MLRSNLLKAGVLLLGTACVFGYTAEDAPVDADQGWTPAQKQQWYTLSQGSRLIPLAWLKALEQSDSEAPLLQRSHTERFRYLADASPDPAPLPVGFAIDTQSDQKFSVTKLRWKNGQSDKEPWVGMNCAACHTNELSYQGKRLRIEGAPALTDFQGYLRSLNAALATTRSDAAKMDRFASKVLAGAATPANRKMLEAALASLVRWQSSVEQANATDLEYGFGRLDAFGHIFNKVLLRTEGGNQPRNPADAPVSYPFLWNIHQHDKVQWNGIAANRPIGKRFDIGALGRNVGEMTGVFADLTLLPSGQASGGYRTSARLDNLLALEKQITVLKPPAWPQAFGPVDADRWEAGQRLFDRGVDGAAACAKCHAVLKRDDLATPIVARMAMLSGPEPIGTDPWMACNAYTYQANTGLLRGTSKKFFPVPGVGKYGETEPLSDLLGTTVIGSIYFKRKELGAVGDLRGWLTSANLYERRIAPAGLPQPLATDDRLRRCMTESSQLLAYKGRPLTGIWATPPFLHNGSVPTLYDLLLPPDQRPPAFLMGTREFDPRKVGLVTGAAAGNTFVFKTRDAAGAPIAGNANLGHDYGNARMTDDERWALVEYMKAVGGTRVGDRVVP